MQQGVVLPNTVIKQGMAEREEQLEALREENRVLSQELAELRALWSQQQQQQSESRLVEQAERLERENRELGERVERLLESRAEKEKEGKELGKVRRHLEEKVSRCMLQDEAKEERMRGLEAELARLRQDREGWEGEMEGLREEGEELRRLSEELQQMVEYLEEEKFSLGEEIDRLEEERVGWAERREEGEAALREREEARAEIARLTKEANNYKLLYDTEVGLNNDNNQVIEDLTRQLNDLQAQMSQPAPAQLLQPKCDYIQSNQYIAECPEEEVRLSGAGSSQLRAAHLLSSHSSRRSTLAQIKRLLREAGQAKLSRRLGAMVQEIILEAEFRERTSNQMREMIVELEGQVEAMEARGQGGSRPREGHMLQLEDRLRSYEQLMGQSERERLELIEEAEALSRENYQLKVELSSSQMDAETEALIEELTLQLEQEKHCAACLSQENYHLRGDLAQLERELEQRSGRVRV